MTPRVARSLLILTALAAARRAAAQDPVRLPGVVVEAPMEKAGPRTLVGVARDTFAIGLDSVEISIPELKRRVLTDGDGKFRFDKIGRGQYTVRARKIGYAPQVRTLEVDDQGGVGRFDLLQLHRALPPVVVNAARGGLGGVVGDTTYRSITHAEVRLMEQGLVAETDSAGYFHFDVGPGQYYVSVSREGYRARTLTVRVPHDSGRRVTVFLEQGTPPAREVHNVDDFRVRLAWRQKTRSSLYSHDDLVDMGIQWVGDVVQGAVTRVAQVKVRAIDPDCVAILNGGPGTVMLRDLTVDEISSIEVYPSIPARASTVQRPKGVVIGKSGIADSRAAVPDGEAFTNTERAAMQNGARSCAVVYVWTR
jgi:hypothetical protein